MIQTNSCQREKIPNTFEKISMESDKANSFPERTFFKRNRKDGPRDAEDADRLIAIQVFHRQSTPNEISLSVVVL